MPEVSLMHRFGFVAEQGHRIDSLLFGICCAFCADIVDERILNSGAFYRPVDWRYVAYKH